MKRELTVEEQIERNWRTVARCQWVIGVCVAIQAVCLVLRVWWLR